MTDNATDEPAINRKRSKAATRKLLSDGVIRNIMSTMPGRLWMWEQLSKAHMFEVIAQFDGEGHVEKTYFALGERNQGLQLLADVMRLCPREYVLAMQENTKLEKDDGKPDSGPSTGPEFASGAEPDGDAESSSGD